MFMARSMNVSSEIAGDAQSFESVFGFVVHRPSGAFGHIGAFELDDDLFDGRRRVEATGW